MRPQSWFILGTGLLIVVLGFLGAFFNVQLLQSNTTTTTTASISGMETIDQRLTLIRGCSDEQTLKFFTTTGLWTCAADDTQSVTGAGAVSLDIGNDGDDSSALVRIITANDTNSIFSESPADTLLIDASLNWPSADTADALSANPADCAANNFATTIAANGDLTCAQVNFTNLAGTATDAQIPNNITIDLATNATNLNADPADCAADTKADAIDAQGDLTCSAVNTGDITDGTILPADLDDGADTPGDEECLTYEGTGLIFEWQNCAAGAGDITDVGPGCATGACLTDGLATSGTAMFIWEGTAVDTNEFTIAVPANPTVDQVFTFPNDQIADDDILLGSGAGTFTYTGLADCTDTGGNHLNYTAGSNSFACGTSSSVTDTNANTICAGTQTYLDGEGGCDTLDGLEDFETATDDAVALGNGATFDSVVITNCTDTSGNHLNYTQATNVFSCGTSSSVTDTNAGTECAGTTTYLDGEGNCDDIAPVYANISGDTFTGTLALSNADLDVGLDCSGFTNGGTLTTTGAGVAHCQDDDDTNTNAATECAGTTTYLDGEGNCDDIDPVYANVSGDTFTGSVTITGAGTLFTLNLDCSGSANGGTLTTTGAGVVFCDDDNSAAGSAIDVEENNVAAVAGATALDFQDPFDVTNDGGEADISIDFTEVDDTTFGSGADFNWTFDSLGTVVMRFIGSVLELAQHLLLDNESELRFGEADGNGSNYLAVVAPGAVTSNQTCTLEDDATFFDSCISDYVEVIGDTMTGTLTITGGANLVLNLDCSGFTNGGTLTTTGAGVVHCQDDDSGAAGDITDVGDCSTGACFTEDGTGNILYFEGTSADTIEHIITAADPTVTDKTWTFPNDEIADDDFLVGSGAGTFGYVSVPDCNTNNRDRLQYDTATNVISCDTDTLLDADIDDTLTVTGSGAVDPDALNCDVGDDDLISEDCFGVDTLTTTVISGLDISDDTNLTCGRSLTISGDGCDADVELFTFAKSIVVTSPATGSHTDLVQLYFGTAVTLTRVVCSTDTDDVTIQFDERAEVTPNTAGTDVLTAVLVCDTDSQITTAFDNAGIAADVPLNLQLTDQTGTPGVLRIHLKYTKDD